LSLILVTILVFQSLLIQNISQYTTTTVLLPFVQDYPGEPVPVETLTTHHLAIFISFFQLPWSVASSLFKLRAWQYQYLAVNQDQLILRLVISVSV